MESDFSISPFMIWRSMGLPGQLVFVWLMLMSIHSLSIMFDRYMNYRRVQRESEGFMDRAREPLERFELDQVMEMARAHPRSHLARIYMAAIRDLENYPRGAPPDGFQELLGRAIEREAVVVSQELKRGLSILASVSATAPFVGLFGTVLGIMNAFFGMAAAGQGGITVVAGGVAEALVNTAAGLFVALPAVWSFNYYLGHVERFNVEMKISGSELVDFFIRRREDDRWGSVARASD